MQKCWQLGVLIGVGLLAVGLMMPHVKLRSEEKVAPASAPTLEYKVLGLGNSTVYYLAIPPKGYAIRPFLAEAALTVEQVAKQTQAIAVINAGFFDPVNQKTTSTVVIDGREMANPKDNERLVRGCLKRSRCSVGSQ